MDFLNKLRILIYQRRWFARNRGEIYYLGVVNVYDIRMSNISFKWEFDGGSHIGQFILYLSEDKNMFKTNTSMNYSLFILDYWFLLIVMSKLEIRDEQSKNLISDLVMLPNSQSPFKGLVWLLSKIDKKEIEDLTKGDYDEC